MYTKELMITRPKDLNNQNTRMILNALMTVAAVEISIPKLKKFIRKPMSVPTTIVKSNLFQDS